MKNNQDIIDTVRRKTVLAGPAIVGLASTNLLAGCGGGGNSSTSTTPTTGTASPGATTPGSSTGGYDGTIAVLGSSFVNGGGMFAQLRGADTEGYVSASINNYNQGTGGDVSGGNYNFDQPHGGPILSALKNWKMNVIRIGINEASWLGYPCYKTDGTTVNPDPHGVYRSQITAQIAALNGIGCYVLLVLGWTNPGRAAPFGQDIMANQDNSIQCWESIAATFGYPNGTALKRNGGVVDDRSVIFELFNEPEPYGDAPQPWNEVMNGGFYQGAYSFNNPFALIYPYPCNGPAIAFKPGESVTISGGITGQVLCTYKNTTTGYPSSGTQFIHLFNLSNTAIASGATITGVTSHATTTTTSASYGWYIAGHSQLLGAVRAAGAWNVCLLSGINYNKDLGEWAKYAPSDTTPPAGYNGPGWKPQIGASWHPYPAWSWVSQAAIASGGSGYKVGDTILLPMPESGPAANTVYWQAQLQVTSVNNGAITGVAINSHTGGSPGATATYGAANFNGNNLVGGAYCNLSLPVNPVPQDSTTGTGTGAAFNLTFKAHDGNSGAGDWPNYDTWAQVVALKNSFNGIGVPICITETGEHTGAGVSGSPWMAAMTSWCDTNGVSLCCFAYNPSSGWYLSTGWDYTLVTSDAKPSPGYGEFMYKWFTNHA
jgi:hypothetical protein